MSNETKRDVLEAILLAKDTDTIWDSSNVRYYLNRYDSALPDDLPVIPEAVGEWIRLCKGKAGINAGINNILDALTLADLEAGDWIEDNSEAFARAWVLGVWSVEETGEIVKLEEEK
ncbi:DUF1642 domain-containing protein [Lacticaseibacillus paracasei]|uniref:DUF1642 domain-containing protein n=1 Tax=Lacticaseibacillus paracasei TaxID=1597 RepID=UPI000E09B1C4|nr:DUF1642 domain-containing protein [Lacticaseibacillus paracasei]RDF83282.1 hypothetical protein DQM24_06135 [Lacticaseibacillus paracasei]RNE28104.1 hypothetical protein FAM6165_02120 [Lacticaseibacillus paracasei]TEA87880.1 hypothetical protein TE33_06675 [Lacticaseibacillus paracasei]